MNSNLTNVYAYMRKRFPDVNMKFSSAPSYLKTLTTIDKKIIFVYKEDLSKYHSPQSNGNHHSGRQRSTDRDPDLDRTGSPLKDDCDIDIIDSSLSNRMYLSKPWTDIEETYSPIDISLAREIMMNINNQTFSKESNGWIFILCSEKTENNIGEIMLASCISAKENNRKIISYNGIIQHSQKTMDHLLDKQYSFISPNTKLETRVESHFEITPNINLKFTNCSTTKNPSILYVDESSEVILNQNFEIGKNHCLCEDLWSQIELLNMIKSDIVSAKNNSFDSEPCYKFGISDSGLSFESLQENVNKILSEMVIVEEDEANIDSGLESVIRRAKSRPITEITDQLWDLLKFTSCYSDLKKIITFIFQISIRSNIVNIPTNNNRLAELIRELCQQRLAIPNLTGTEPLELLLEIGIEKLMKDYEFIFCAGKICKLSDMKSNGKKEAALSDASLNVRKSLAPSMEVKEIEKIRKTLLHCAGNSTEATLIENLGIRNSRFVEQEADLNISKLAQIHLIVEHLLLIQNNLNLDNDYSAITKKLLEKSVVPFEDLKEQKLDYLEIPILDKKAIHLVENLIPNVQKITMKSENKFRVVENIFYFNLEPIIPSLVISDEDYRIVDKKNNNFHYISCTGISTKLCTSIGN